MSHRQACERSCIVGICGVGIGSRTPLACVRGVRVCMSVLIELIVPTREVGGERFFFADRGKLVPVVLVNHAVNGTFRASLVEVTAAPAVIVRAGGLAWREVFTTDLVTHMILKRCVLTKPLLSQLCQTLGIPVRKRPGEKSITKLAYLEAVVAHTFPEEPNETRAELAHTWSVGPHAGNPSGGLGDEAVDLLDEDNQADFAADNGGGNPDRSDQLDEEAADAAGLNQLGRAADAGGLNQPAGGEAAAPPAPAAPAGAPGAKKPQWRGPQQNFTLQCIKELVPGRCKIPGVFLVWRRTIRQWEARYQAGLPKTSMSKTWGGKQGLTELDALLRTVDWMWAQHEQAGLMGVGEEPPSVEKVRAALDQLHAEWASREAGALAGGEPPAAGGAAEFPAPAEPPAPGGGELPGREEPGPKRRRRGAALRGAGVDRCAWAHGVVRSLGPGMNVSSLLHASGAKETSSNMSIEHVCFACGHLVLRPACGDGLAAFAAALAAPIWHVELEDTILHSSGSCCCHRGYVAACRARFSAAGLGC